MNNDVCRSVDCSNDATAGIADNSRRRTGECRPTDLDCNLRASRRSDLCAPTDLFALSVGEHAASHRCTTGGRRVFDTLRSPVHCMTTPQTRTQARSAVKRHIADSDRYLTDGSLEIISTADSLFTRKTRHTASSSPHGCQALSSSLIRSSQKFNASVAKPLLDTD